jgi:hypothetical protein
MCLRCNGYEYHKLTLEPTACSMTVNVKTVVRQNKLLQSHQCGRRDSNPQALSSTGT